MQTFHDKYFDGDVDFNGDALEVMEYRHDWASFRFTLELFKFVFLNFAPEMILHSRSQGMREKLSWAWILLIIRRRGASS